jgi:5-methylcytosine-specific restriction endonuclease McrA
VTHRSYRDGDYEQYLWDFRDDEFIDDPDEDIDCRLRGCGQDAADRQEAYDEYLASDYWQKVRSAMMARHGGKCQSCGATDNLQVHHKDYPKRYTELQNLHMLELLCQSCHLQSH